jgi:hypothetical protein
LFLVGSKQESELVYFLQIVAYDAFHPILHGDHVLLVDAELSQIGLVLVHNAHERLNYRDFARLAQLSLVC